MKLAVITSLLSVFFVVEPRKSLKAIFCERLLFWVLFSKRIVTAVPMY